MKSEPEKVDKVNPETWCENNSWIYDEPLFSYNDLKNGVHFRLYPTGNPDRMKEIFLKDLQQAAFTKAYNQVLEKKREAYRKEFEKLSEKLFFGEPSEPSDQWEDLRELFHTQVKDGDEIDLQKFLSKMKQAPWVAVEDNSAGTEFRVKLFWKIFEITGDSMDLSELVSIVNRTWKALENGVHGLTHDPEEEKDGTDQSRAGCADC